FVAIEPFDLGATMAQQVLGHFDPTGTRGADSFRKVHLTPDGRPVTWVFTRAHNGFLVRVHGTDAAAVLSEFLGCFPLADGRDGFNPVHPLLRRLAHSYGGLRLLRVPWAFDVAAGAVLQQRVRWRVAYNDFGRIAKRWGTPAAGGMAFPSARQLADVSIAALEAQGIDPKRARALHALARREAVRPFLSVERNPERLRLRLQQLPGIGP